MTFRKFSPSAQCHGKRPYSDKDDAKAAARKSEQAFGRMKPYRCPWCEHWHIGHAPKAKQAQRPA